MEVAVGAVDLDGLVPHDGVRARHRFPVELDEARLARRVDQAEGVHAEALHHAKAARQGAVRHDPHQHVRRLRHQRDEVPEGVVRAGGLRHAVVRLGLDGVDQVGKLDRVLDEEHRNVVADDVPVAFVGVELDREAAHVARQIGRAPLAGDGREADEHGRALAGFGERRCLGDGRQLLVALEVAVRRGTPRVDDALRNALVVEVGDLLAQDEVLEQGRATQAGLERVLVVGDRDAHVRGQRLATGIDADAVERPVAGVEALGRFAQAELVGDDVFGHRAGGVDEGVWRDGFAGHRRVPVFQSELRRLERIERYGGDGELRADLLRGEPLLRHGRQLPGTGVVEQRCRRTSESGQNGADRIECGAGGSRLGRFLECLAGSCGHGCSGASMHTALRQDVAGVRQAPRTASAINEPVARRLRRTWRETPSTSFWLTGLVR